MHVRLGLRENLAQFALLVVVNAFVGAMVGMERSILPAIAEQEFHLAARTAILSFIVVFGVAKALTNYFAGRLSDRFGRKHVLVAGWLVAVPVPFLLMWAPTWNWVLVANVLLGVSQGLTWSTTVIMKIDLVGSEQRGLAMGLNEFAGYFAVAASALATGWIAARYGLRPAAVLSGRRRSSPSGLRLSALFVRETRHHVAHESAASARCRPTACPTPREVFWRTTLADRNLSSVSQAGLVNNLNDGMAWGLFPLFFAAAGMGLAQIGDARRDLSGDLGCRAAGTGALSDRIGRKWLIVWRHVDAGGRHRRRGAWSRGVRRVRGRRRPARHRHRDGLSDAARRDRRRRAPVLARVGGRRLSALARSRLCDRRAARGRHRRRVRPARRDVARRRADVCVRCRLGRTNDGDPAAAGTASPTEHVQWRCRSEMAKQIETDTLRSGSTRNGRSRCSTSGPTKTARNGRFREAST